MSDVDPDLDLVDEDADNLKELRTAAKRSKENAEKAATTERRAVFAEAGVPRSGKMAELFRESYRGDLTEDAVKGAWDELVSEIGGLPKNEETAVDPTDDLKALEAARTGGNVVDPADKPKPSPIDEGWEAYNASRKKGRPEAVASAEISTRVIDAAVKGDERVLVKAWTPEELREAQQAVG